MKCFNFFRNNFLEAIENTILTSLKIVYIRLNMYGIRVIVLVLFVKFKMKIFRKFMLKKLCDDAIVTCEIKKIYCDSRYIICCWFNLDFYLIHARRFLKARKKC